MLNIGTVDWERLRADYRDSPQDSEDRFKIVVDSLAVILASLFRLRSILLASNLNVDHTRQMAEAQTQVANSAAALQLVQQSDIRHVDQNLLTRALWKVKDYLSVKGEFDRDWNRKQSLSNTGSKSKAQLFFTASHHCNYLTFATNFRALCSEYEEVCRGMLDKLTVNYIAIAKSQKKALDPDTDNSEWYSSAKVELKAKKITAKQQAECVRQQKTPAAVSRNSIQLQRQTQPRVLTEEKEESELLAPSLARLSSAKLLAPTLAKRQSGQSMLGRKRPLMRSCYNVRPARKKKLVRVSFVYSKPVQRKGERLPEKRLTAAERKSCEQRRAAESTLYFSWVLNQASLQNGVLRNMTKVREKTRSLA